MAPNGSQTSFAGSRTSTWSRILALPYHHMGATITDGVLQAGLR